jgi:predicted Zn finger-like uncharacterized protein
MYTVCPKCALTLAVTAGDLRVAQGHVRCGRCQHVFNALTRLTSEDRQGGMADPDSTAVQPGPEIEAHDDEPIPEGALEFNADASKVFVEALPAPKWTPTGTYRGPGLHSNTGGPPDGTLEIEPLDIEGTLETPTLTAPVEPLPPRRTQLVAPRYTPARKAMAAEPEEHQETVPVSSEVWKPRRTRMPDPDLPLPASLLQKDRTPIEAALAAQPRSAFQADPQAAAHAILRRERSPRRMLWLGGSVVLALLLAAQLIHHARNDLAVYPQLRGPLTQLYSALGIELVPRWDLTAYDVRQLGASASAARAGQTTVTVRASIGLKKTASQAQPLPMLRVTLQDRLGNPTGARDVLPEAYLPATRGSTAFLTAGERIDTQIAFIDLGGNAQNFEIDACLRTPGGGTACANDAARH